MKVNIYHTFELTNDISCWYNYDDIFHSAYNFITPGSSYLSQLQQKFRMTTINLETTCYPPQR